MKTKPFLNFLVYGLAAIFLSGCGQKTVYLMPSPIALKPGTDFFNLSDTSKYENRLVTLYATNRIPFTLSNESDNYTIFPSDDLRLGYVVHSVGEEGTTWQEFYDKSLKRERQESIRISLDYFQEMVHIDEKQELTRLASDEETAFDSLNKRLAVTADKDITVYVHGANSNLYRATAQGAQYFHYTGHNSTVLTFSWPSAENIMKYKTDVMHAKKTVPAFARLIELLAIHTRARNINILAYSAGAQVAAPGLVFLREKYSHLGEKALRNKLRIGEVYFAAPDIEFQSFAHRYNIFKDIVLRTTISSNTNDSVLRYARLHSGKSRLGRPNAKELSDEERDIFIKYSSTDMFDILDMRGSTALAVGKSHNFWYAHPWVSSDLLLLMLFNLPPEERGLVRHVHESGLTIFHFPEDYKKRTENLLNRLGEQASSKVH